MVGTEYKFTASPQLSVVDMRRLYERMEAEGLTDVVFYDGEIKKWQDWANFMLQEQCWLVRCERADADVEGGEDGVVGLWWLNNFICRSAMIHFCAFKNQSFEDKVEIGKQSMRWLASKSILDSLYGLTPKPYRHIPKYLKATGFQTRGELPGACNMVKNKKVVPGILSVLDLKIYESNSCHGGGC